MLKQAALTVVRGAVRLVCLIELWGEKMSRILSGVASACLIGAALTACTSSTSTTSAADDPVAAVAAAERPAWFGLNPPAALADPQIAPTEAVPPSVLPQGESANGALGGARIRQSVDQVVEFSREMRRQGNQMWGRISGFPSEAATADWLATELDAAGFQGILKQTYKATGEFWWPKAWTVSVVADKSYGDLSIDVKLSSAVPVSGSFIPSAIEAPAVFVGDAGEVSTEGVSGKIAIQHTHPAAGAFSDRTKVRESSAKLIQAGAVGVITWVEQSGNMHVFDFGRCGGPCFNIGGADGRFLTEAIAKAKASGKPELKMKLTLDAENKAGLSGRNVLGILPGKSNEVIIVNAHLDSWFDGAGDNADGVGVLLALARYFAQKKDDLPRTLVFVGSGGHHSAGMNGPGNLVTMNADLMKRVVLVINLEHLAQFKIDAVPAWNVRTSEQPKGFGVSNMSPYLVNLVNQAATRYGFVLDGPIDNSVPGDLGGYAPLGVARIQGIHSGPLYHTSGDTLASISTPGLEKAARFYAYIVEQASKAPAKSINP
jgi:hypothetical protein